MSYTPQHQKPVLYTGVIRNYGRNKKLFGFVIREDGGTFGGRDALVHADALTGVHGISDVHDKNYIDGLVIEFEVEHRPAGPRAANIKIVGDKKLERTSQWQNAAADVAAQPAAKPAKTPSTSPVIDEVERDMKAARSVRRGGNIFKARAKKPEA